MVAISVVYQVKKRGKWQKFNGFHKIALKSILDYNSAQFLEKMHNIRIYILAFMSRRKQSGAVDAN